MIDFEVARATAKSEISATHIVEDASAQQIQQWSLQNYSAVWVVETELFSPNGSVLPICLIVALPFEFPLVLPKVILHEEYTDELGIIPHLSRDGMVCTFDSETVTVDPNQPGKVVLSCLIRARSILEAGLSQTNSEDYNDEFVSYWGEQYSKFDRITRGLSMLNSTPAQGPCNIACCRINPHYGPYGYLLFDDNDKSASQLKIHLKKKGHTLKPDGNALYLGCISNLRPPFDLKGRSLLEFVTQHFVHAVKDATKYINSTTANKIMLFSLSELQIGEARFFGWEIPTIQTTRNGYRTKSLFPTEVLRTFQHNDQIGRLQFDTYTSERLQRRTNGVVSTKDHTLTIAGLGSIGSNLIPYLIPLGIKSVNLIDPETLALENINRHLLGPDHIDKPKASGIRDYLRFSNPISSINVYNESVIKILRDKISIVNDSNMLIVAIGKTNIENFIIDYLRDYIITVPTVIIWVEPYLLGGHCLFLLPGHTLFPMDLYNNGYYKYNIISDTEYQNPDKALLLREAGCQGSFVPYGSNNIALFLSALVPHLFRLSEGVGLGNTIISWRGSSNPTSLILSDYGNTIPEQSMNTISF